MSQDQLIDLLAQTVDSLPATVVVDKMVAHYSVMDKHAILDQFVHKPWFPTLAQVVSGSIEDMDDKDVAKVLILFVDQYYPEQITAIDGDNKLESLFRGVLLNLIKEIRNHGSGNS